ncbi:hypothetical protein O181_125705 [Austropuccinia psidii MF-1]|uniref:Uncharacterized protein n=1 Tax=Austropuccinia psidii MF-1 TaxID=1389203 RepID=A0A9Q3KQ58_9BASI|nr:hypothetical protein [Austropuccinia psidii MF-1]
MDLDQGIQVINSKDKIVIQEAKNKWSITELQPVPKVSEKLPTGGSRDIPVSVQELVYGRKAAGVGTSAQIVHRDNELLPSSEKALGPRKDTRASEGLTPMSCKGHVQKVKDWFKNQSILSEDKMKELDQKKEKSPAKAPQASTSKNLPQQVKNTGMKAPKNKQKGKGKQSGTSPTPRTTELKRRKRQPWTMCSIWQEL